MKILELIKVLPDGRTTTHHTAYTFKHEEGAVYVSVYSYPSIEDAMRASNRMATTDLLIGDDTFLNEHRDTITAVIKTMPGWESAVELEF